ncbi:hypothetical protein [Variovorax sp. PAMC 28711]|uniref:hypothetical protein n=1 Tax=Variovorax sp. PAMC 28711 TaxID=1795631 RepID=UPI00078B833D|nr:hypothetical protein [Variovorax sp. PAMC 28711]AMM23026.1 hypothetical protein AX767_00485 [Variovorax sp. PAMC 28711]
MNTSPVKDSLPELPKPDICVDTFGDVTATDRRYFVRGDFFSADQMREYGRLCALSLHPAPSAAEPGEPTYAECFVCGRLMDGLSEDDCHCFHRKEIAAAPSTAQGLSDADSRAFTQMVKGAIEMGWISDDEGKTFRAILAATKETK